MIAKDSILYGIISHICSIYGAFMWTSKDPPISWIEMYKSRDEGGLEFRDLKVWNLTLLAKVL